MKIMIIGIWKWPQYEEAFARGLSENGITVIPFPTHSFFNGTLGQYQLTLPLISPSFLNFNKKIIDKSIKENPDLIIFWRPTHVFPRTIKKLNKQGIKTVSYNNDDPFGPQTHGNVPWHHHWLWFWYLKCLPCFDYNFFYRQINCKEAKKIGAAHAEVLMPYFLPWKDQPVKLTGDEKSLFEVDVVFVGHYEPDGRENSVRALMDSGISLKIWGGKHWNSKVLNDMYDNLKPITPAEGDNYAKALCGAKICLAFLSKLNRDTYTRRCLEIPACNCVMLAERTSDLQNMFKEDEEACFFSSNEELIQKVHWLLDHPDVRRRIAKAARQRVWADGHDVTSRTKQFLNKINTHVEK